MALERVVRHIFFVFKDVSDAVFSLIHQETSYKDDYWTLNTWILTYFFLSFSFFPPPLRRNDRDISEMLALNLFLFIFGYMNREIVESGVVVNIYPILLRSGSKWGWVSEEYRFLESSTIIVISCIREGNFIRYFHVDWFGKLNRIKNTSQRNLQSEIYSGEKKDLIGSLWKDKDIHEWFQLFRIPR